MANVTDSLEFTLEHLGELQHELDALGDELRSAAFPDAASALLWLNAWGKVAGHLAWILGRIEAEHALLVRLGEMVRSNKCSNCGRWFEVPSSSASRRRYCSAACKQAAYRARLDQGEELSLDEIT